jgi:hypothetical protein
MNHADAHGTLAHSEHRQGDVALADGSRLFSCTKILRQSTRTSMLLVKGLGRIDVVSEGEAFTVLLRPLGTELRGGPETMHNRPAKSIEGRDEVVSDFWFEPTEGPVGRVSVSVTRPRERGERFPCTLIAVVPRRAS